MMEHSFDPMKIQERTSDGQPPMRQMKHLRARSIGAGIVAAFLLTLLIALGSRGFHWFDVALIGSMLLPGLDPSQQSCGRINVWVSAQVSRR